MESSTIKSELYLAIFGLFGSGKTTLARGLLQSDGGAINIRDNKDIKYCVSSGKKYTFAGHYLENSKFGGGDTIYCRNLYKILQKSPTPIFISEGCRVQSFGPQFLRAFFSTKTQGIVYLRGAPSLCCERVLKRGGGSASSNYDKLTLVENLVKKFIDLGTNVLVLDINNSKDYILQQTLNFIDELQK